MKKRILDDVQKFSSIIDCSSLSLREEEGTNLGFQIPELDNIFIIDQYFDYLILSFGPTYNKYEVKTGRR